MTRTALLSLLAVFAAGCAERSYTTLPHATEDQLVVKLYQTPKNMELVRQSDSVTACRLEHPEAWQRFVNPAEYAAGPVVELTPEQSKRAKDLLTNPRYYYFDDIAKACGDPVFGVRLRFNHADEHLDANLCFKCGDIAITQDAEVVGWADFEFVKADLAKLCKELFPQDAAIQKLP